MSERLATLEIELRDTPHSAERFCVPLDDDDYRLLLSWANYVGNLRTNESQEAFAFIRKSLGDFEAARLWSARVAEKTTMGYYRALGRDVVDTSITQLSLGASEWKTHDIVASRSLLDVKNARRSFPSKSYSEYSVARFKVARRSEEVRVVGVLSQYLTADQIAGAQSSTVVELGEVSRADIQELQQWMNEMFGDVLDLSTLQDDGFLPGWVFEYPEEYQPKRGNALNSIPDLILDWKRENVGTDTFPKYLLPFSDDEEFIGAFEFTSAELRVWHQLIAQRREIGFSRRTLFGFVLGNVLSNLRTSSDIFPPCRLLEWLFSRRDAMHIYPLGLHDPEMYIWSLIQTLQQMWDLVHDQLLTFQMFRLRGPRILQGRDQSGHWRTIIAYCGGRLGKPFGKCGKDPIFLGESRSCSTCGRLVCPECSFCSNHCAEGKLRLARADASI